MSKTKKKMDTIPEISNDDISDKDDVVPLVRSNDESKIKELIQAKMQKIILDNEKNDPIFQQSYGLTKTPTNIFPEVQQMRLRHLNEDLQKVEKDIALADDDDKEALITKKKTIEKHIHNLTYGPQKRK